MSVQVCMEPEAFKNNDKMESVVDIYVSSESLQVHETPWVEGISTITPGSVDKRQSGQDVVHQNHKRRHCLRLDSVCLGLLCSFLLIGIICLAIKFHEDKSQWESERALMLAEHAILLGNLSLSVSNGSLLGNGLAPCVGEKSPLQIWT